MRKSNNINALPRVYEVPLAGNMLPSVALCVDKMDDAYPLGNDQLCALFRMITLHN